MKISKENRKIISDLCKKHRVRFRITTNLNCHGAADTIRGIIYINPNASKRAGTLRVLLSTCLHEINHILCKREGKFRRFHSDKAKLTKADLRAIIATAWRAEKYVDARAAKMMKIMFPKMNYEFAYKTKSDKEWLDREFLSYFRFLLKKKRG